MPDPRHPDRPDPEVADASFLFDDEPASPAPEPSRSRRAPGPADDLEGYAVEGVEETEDVAPTPPTRGEAPPRPRRAAGPVPEDDSEAPARRRSPAEDATVEQVWSRAAEWAQTLALLGLVGLGVAMTVYLTFSSIGLGVAVVVAAFGTAALVLLSYPIVVTLERPVRLTPEQALKDYFGALSHHVPHYRRMWLLLSDRGRASVPGNSFADFRDYWKGRLADWRAQGGVKSGTPLTFQVAECKSEDKSAGKSAIEATATVNVLARGRESDGPIASYRYKLSFVRGPDRMWYLNRGNLPDKS